MRSESWGTLVASVATRDELSEALPGDGLELTWAHIAIVVIVVSVGVATAMLARRRLRRGDVFREVDYAPAVHRETWAPEDE